MGPPEKTIECPHCFKIIKQTHGTYLRSHMKSQHPTGERARFPCPFSGCGKSYFEKGDTVRHFKREHSENPLRFPCTLCGKEFKSNAHLHRHIATHRTEKSHKCAICGKAFEGSDYLKTHKTVHQDKSDRPSGTKQVQMPPVSSNLFAENGTFLNYHMQVGHRDKEWPTYSCEKFGYTSFVKSNLTSHSKRVHGGVKRQSSEQIICSGLLRKKIYTRCERYAFETCPSGTKKVRASLDYILSECWCDQQFNDKERNHCACEYAIDSCLSRKDLLYIWHQARAKCSKERMKTMSILSDLFGIIGPSEGLELWKKCLPGRFEESAVTWGSSSMMTTFPPIFFNNFLQNACILSCCVERLRKLEEPIMRDPRLKLSYLADEMGVPKLTICSMLTEDFAAELFGNGRIKILSTTKSDQGDPERCHLPQKE
ncbi:Zinc finger protein 16 [Folsomia candida]|uniref:Zinc finger protein 16 n=1 Tax=Folsomia candida TaxID=158441 RepID=A0A226D8H3_FOLCA|nr:Zinc finger protein 16 [Folsomia candida]